jgi:hypothetical protein
VLVKALGGPLPPVVWDGVDNYVRKGQTAPETIKVQLKDGPVVKLNFAKPGAVMTAKPEVKQAIDDGPIAEPKPVVLPRGQAGL